MVGRHAPLQEKFRLLRQDRPQLRFAFLRGGRHRKIEIIVFDKRFLHMRQIGFGGNTVGLHASFQVEFGHVFRLLRQNPLQPLFAVRGRVLQRELVIIVRGQKIRSMRQIRFDKDMIPFHAQPQEVIRLVRLNALQFLFSLGRSGIQSFLEVFIVGKGNENAHQIRFGGDTIRLHALAQMEIGSCQSLNLLQLFSAFGGSELQGDLEVLVVREDDARFPEGVLPRESAVDHAQHEVKLGILRVEVQRFLAVIPRFVPIVLEHQDRNALPHLRNIRIRIRPGRAGRRGGGISFSGVHDLHDTAKDVLDEPDLSHVLALEHGKFLRDVVGVHVPVAGDEEFRGVLLHDREEAAPFVLHPDGLEVFLLRADHEHDFRGVERGEDVGFILLAELVLERDTGEEDLQALIRELVVDVLGEGGVLRARAAVGRFLVADEDVVGLFLRGNAEDVLLDLGDAGRLLLINGAFGGGGEIQGVLIILVGEDGVELHAVAGRDAFVRDRVLDVLDAVFRDQQSPVCFRVLAVAREDGLVGRDGLVEVVCLAEMLRAAVDLLGLRVGDLRKCREAAAILAFARGHAVRQVVQPAAHLALDLRHVVLYSKTLNSDKRFFISYYTTK